MNHSMATQSKDNYDPISTLMSFQHKKNHYKHIINPRKTQISFCKSQQQQKNKKLSSYLSSKYQKIKEKQRKKNNKQIYKQIYSIVTQKKGILQKAEQQFREYQKDNKDKPRRSLVNAFRAKQQLQRINKQNDSLHKKIINLKPLICNKDELQRHQQFSEQMRKKLKSKSIIRQQKLADQNIMKLVIQDNNSKNINGQLNMYHTLNLRYPSIINQSNKKTQTTRNNRRTLKFKQNTQFSQKKSVLNQQQDNQFKKIQKQKHILINCINQHQKAKRLYSLSLKQIILRNQQ